jgi:hypothetical protein
MDLNTILNSISALSAAIVAADVYLQKTSLIPSKYLAVATGIATLFGAIGAVALKVSASPHPLLGPSPPIIKPVASVTNLVIAPK